MYCFFFLLILQIKLLSSQLKKVEPTLKKRQSHSTSFFYSGRILQHALISNDPNSSAVLQTTRIDFHFHSSLRSHQQQSNDTLSEPL